MTLEERIKVLEDRVAILERLVTQPQTTPSYPLYPWHEKDTIAPVYPTAPVYPIYPNTWCCARNTHEEEGT